jgi:hypothetical protein
LKRLRWRIRQVKVLGKCGLITILPAAGLRALRDEHAPFEGPSKPIETWRSQHEYHTGGVPACLCDFLFPQVSPGAYS